MKVLQRKSTKAEPKKVQKVGAKVKALAKTEPKKVQKSAPAVQALFKTAPEVTSGTLLKHLKHQGSLEIIQGDAPRSTKLLGELQVTPEFEVDIKGTHVVMVSLQNSDGTEFTGNGVHLPVNGNLGERGYGKHVIQEGAIPKQYRRGYGRNSGIGFFYDPRLGYIRLKRFEEGSYAVPSVKRKVTTAKKAKK